MNDTIRSLRDSLVPIYGRGEANAMIRLIFHTLKGWDTSEILTRFNDELSPYLREQTERIVTRLKAHEPIQYILGEAYFYGLRFKVTPDVLIPRQDTEPLVDMIVNQNPEEDLRVLDIGTGSGCIAIALARFLKFPQVSALDISEAALKVARENASDLKVKVNFIHADIFTYKADPESLDIIVSNPPYIDESEKAAMDANVKDYEPASALFVPDDNPVVFYRRISSVAKDALTAGGRLYLEINPRHASEVADILKADGFADVAIYPDIHGTSRFISCTKPKLE